MTEFNQKIGIIGCGFVGSAMIESLSFKGLNVKQYDKYKNGGIGTFESMLTCLILFLCLPTIYDSDKLEYDKTSLHEVCIDLKKHDYKGIVVIKSTVEPGTTKNFYETYHLNFIHNPEFLSAKTALHDFHNQTHIVIGKSCDFNINTLLTFYETYYSAQISICNSTESETMKIACNCFYAVKIQYFNEIYALCQKLEIDYDNVKNLMLKNGWINPMHTLVPGTDGQLSYGGYCFPKDMHALNEMLKRKQIINAVINSSIEEREKIRTDHLNCK